jgi:hypothetical protein
MTTNIIGISGLAGSGKDTVAEYLVEHYGFVRIALADEMKRFAKKVFDFSDDQLWGPSANRNAVDKRFEDDEEWEKAEDRLFDVGPEWCAKLCGDKWGQGDDAWTDLLMWFDDLREDWSTHGDNRLSPRIMLQTIGTEWGRAQGEDVWVNYTIEMAKKLLLGGYSYSKEDGIAERLDGSPVKGVVISDCRFKNELAAIKTNGGRTIRVKRPGIVLAQVGVVGHQSESEQASIPDTGFDHVLESPEGLGNLAIYLTAIVPNIVRSLS